MRRITPFLIALAVLYAPEPAAAQSSGGTVEGSVTLSRALAPRRPRFRIYSDAGKGATPPSTPATDLRDEYANVVLYLELDDSKALAAGPARHPERPSITQKDERFIPHVLPIVQGTTVDFPNEDEFFHNVFSLSGPRRFDLPKYPAGSSRSVTFPKTGVVNVFCHIHADMSAAILVVDGPGYAVPDSAGRYVLAGLPPGDYTLIGWHERSEPVRRVVHVAAGATTRLDVRIPIADTPAPGR